MKMSLCQMIVIVCILPMIAIWSIPVQMVHANDFVRHADVYIDRVTHANGTVTHTTTRYTLYRNIHTEPGSHQHPLASITVYYNDVSCSSSQCYYCD